MHTISDQTRHKIELKHLIFTHLKPRGYTDLSNQIQATLRQCNISVGQLEAVLDVLEGNGSLHQVCEALN